MIREEAINKYIIPAIKNTWNNKTCEEIIKAMKIEPCEDCISRESIKQKLQEHHDFFVNAYGGFSNLPHNDKSRVDEISECIAMVVNEPPATQQPVFCELIKYNVHGNDACKCNKCNMDLGYPYKGKFCKWCGSKIQEVKK